MEHIALFAKVPREGGVKTRLVPPLREGQALALHLAMLHDQWAFLASLSGARRSVELRLDGPWPGVAVAPPPLPPPALQGEGDLGARMRRAIAEALARGAARAAVLGADAPSLPRERVDEALARVALGADAALVPALDGGYVLVAARRDCAALFSGVPWGTAGVLDATRRAARETGLRLETTAPWGDVDRPEDLRRLRRELAVAPARAPRTAAVLASLDLDSREFGVV